MVVMMRSDAHLTSSLSSDPWLSTMWWIPGTAGGSTADATDILDRFRDFWVAVAPKIANGVSIQMQGTCVAVESATGVLTGVFSGTAGTAVASSAGSGPLPAQTQGLIRWLTNGIVLGRQVKGRTFVPLPDEGDNQTTGQPGSSYTVQLGLGGAAILAAGATASAACVWHRPGPGGAGSAHAITGYTPQSTWAVLRSRR